MLQQAASGACSGLLITNCAKKFAYMLVASLQEELDEPSSQPEAEPASDEETPAAANEAEVAAPTIEHSAADEPAPAVPPACSGSAAATTKQLHLGLKRKPGLVRNAGVVIAVVDRCPLGAPARLPVHGAGVKQTASSCSCNHLTPSSCPPVSAI